MSSRPLNDVDAALVSLIRQASLLADPNSYFGSACPKDMVQVEFVGVAKELKYSDYGWKPSKTAVIELYVGGERFRIEAGWVAGTDGNRRRGVRVFLPNGSVVRQDAGNTIDLVFDKTAERMP